MKNLQTLATELAANKMQLLVPSDMLHLQGGKRKKGGSKKGSKRSGKGTKKSGHNNGGGYGCGCSCGGW